MTMCSAERASVAHQPEDVRNRVMRRADWRFLLPTPCPDVVGCDDDPTLLECSRRMFASVLPAPTAPPASCDLVVLEGPDDAALANALTALKPGGACYVEYRGPTTDAGRARSRLMTAGFHHVRAYWPWPSAARCRAWLPLDFPEAASAYFDQQDAAARLGLGRRLLMGPQIRKGRRRQRSGRTGHVSVVGRKPFDTVVGDDAGEAWVLRSSGATGVGLDANRRI